MTRHVGIVAVSAEGAALCYRTLCGEGAALLGPYGHPEVTMHTHSLADYMRPIDAAGGTRSARCCSRPPRSCAGPAPSS